MKNLLIAVMILVPLSVGVDTKDSGGQSVEIILRNAGKFEGEILSVRDSSIVITTQRGLSESEMIEKKWLIRVIPDSVVAFVQTPGSSYGLVGGLAGFAVGSLVGCSIGGSMKVTQEKNDILGCSAGAEKTSNMTGGAAIGGLIGGLLGCVFGNAASQATTVYVGPQSPRDFHILKTLARYETEPEFLKTIGAH